MEAEITHQPRYRAIDLFLRCVHIGSHNALLSCSCCCGSDNPRLLASTRAVR